MRERLLAGPGEITAAWAVARGFDLADKYADIFGVAILGTGAAGVAGMMAAAITAGSAQIPVVAVAGEELPAFVGPDTLVIACDVGDGTESAEDTALAFEEAADRGSKVVIVGAGEAWAARSVAHRCPLLVLPSVVPGPLAPAGPLVALLSALHAAGVVARPDDVVAGAIAALETLNTASREPSDDPVAPNLAQQVARHIAGRAVAVQGLGVLASAAGLGRAVFSAVGVLPLPDEYGLVEDIIPSTIGNATAIIALRSPYDPPRALARARAAAATWEGRGITSVAVPVDGSSRLAASLWAAGFLGWVAHYLREGDG